ncbi:MAG: DUF1501 domain-containing protein [Planctomycetes bacterium]|nr:DUF1501 domain-containing protein [Planctomycetota bacterium]
MTGFSRRAFLQSHLGFGTLAAAYLLHADGLLGPARAAPGGMDMRPRGGHFPSQATSVIFLMQSGGPSQVDLFDPKPELQRRDGQRHPGEVESFQPGSHDNRLMACAHRFRRHGQSGMDFSELLPHMGEIADEWCMVRSMFSDNNNHPQAMRCVNTGKIFAGRPTLGAWVSYALGTEKQNLPAFVVLRDPDGYSSGGATQWENGWLPAQFRGTEVQSRGAAILNLRPHSPLPDGVQRANLEALARLNEERRRLYPSESDLDARLRNYELAARMQLNAEQLLDLSREPASIRRLYGVDNPVTANFGTRCLMARRLVESGVRFVQVMVPVSGGGWDHHSDIRQGLARVCPQVDRPSAALVKDLKARGLLDRTIILWTGEFGRLPITQGGTGRDHNRHAFTLLLAGGGFKPGHIHGATDEFGYQAVERRVSCPSLLATLLHQLGLDHERLGYRHNGREETLTDAPVTGARVVRDLLA